MPQRTKNAETNAARTNSAPNADNISQRRMCVSVSPAASTTKRDRRSLAANERKKAQMSALSVMQCLGQNLLGLLHISEQPRLLKSFNALLGKLSCLQIRAHMQSRCNPAHLILRRAILPLCLLMASTVLYGQFSTVPCTNGETGICRQATTCSQANVQAAVNASSAGTTGYVSPTNFGGDGVYVPAGTCSWSSPVSWTNKNINVIGANPTISPSGDQFDVSVTGAAGTGQTNAASFRISGFTQSGGHFLNINVSNPNMSTWAGYYRVDHINYTTSAGGNNFIIYGPVYGVFDHLTGSVGGGNHFEQAMFLNSEYPPSTTAVMGETVGRTFAIGLGDQNAVYLEDSTLTCSGVFGSGALSDSESGPQRFVLRHNTILGTCYNYAHWTRNGEWDGGRIESYNNIYNCTGPGCSGGYPGRFNAATGVIFNNQIVNYGTPSFQIDEARGCGAQTGGVVGTCVGSPPGNSQFDVNAGDTNAPGWPCAGQVGTACIAGNCTRSTMNSVPFIMWNNGAQTGCSTGGSCTNSITFNVDGPPGGGSCTRTATNYLKSTAHSLSGGYNGAIDYFSGASKPSSVGIYTGIASYTPFTYPYPTTTGGVTTYTLSTATAGSGAGTITGCAGTYPPGGIYTCTPHAGTGSTLASISGCGGTWNGTVLQGAMPAANCTVTATFTGTSIPVATGDSRTVTEPTFPGTICAQVPATKFIKQTNTKNIDPWNATCGSTGGTFGVLGCTGGTSWEPSSSSTSYVEDESLDNAALVAAQAACPVGQAVEIVPGASGQRAIVIAPFKQTRVFTVDAGIDVYGSLTRSDFEQTNCGLVVPGTSSCKHWWTAPGTSGLGVYGYGKFIPRGWDHFNGSTTQGWYANRTQAYCNNHGGPINGYPACTPNGAGNNSYGPNGFDLVGTNNYTMYKVTVQDSGNFLLNWTGGNGFTAWGVKLLAPFEMSNTDGFDPINGKNATFTRGYISNGDNQMAAKASSSSISNITVSNTQTGAGIALAIGSATQHTVSNILVTDIVQNGNLHNADSAGLADRFELSQRRHSRYRDVQERLHGQRSQLHQALYQLWWAVGL
jgi:hypothetical protein